MDWWLKIEFSFIESWQKITEISIRLIKILQSKHQSLFHSEKTGLNSFPANLANFKALIILIMAYAIIEFDLIKFCLSFKNDWVGLLLDYICT